MNSILRKNLWRAGPVCERLWFPQGENQSSGYIDITNFIFSLYPYYVYEFLRVSWYSMCKKHQKEKKRTLGKTCPRGFEMFGIKAVEFNLAVKNHRLGLHASVRVVSLTTPRSCLPSHVGMYVFLRLRGLRARPLALRLAGPPGSRPRHQLTRSRKTSGQIKYGNGTYFFLEIWRPRATGKVGQKVFYEHPLTGSLWILVALNDFQITKLKF